MSTILLYVLRMWKPFFWLVCKGFDERFLIKMIVGFNTFVNAFESYKITLLMMPFERQILYKILCDNIHDINIVNNIMHT